MQLSLWVLTRSGTFKKTNIIIDTKAENMNKSPRQALNKQMTTHMHTRVHYSLTRRTNAARTGRLRRGTKSQLSPSLPPFLPPIYIRLYMSGSELIRMS